MNETRSFEHTPESAAAARRFATDQLSVGTSRETLEAVQLMVSELATNCIRHTAGGFDLTVVRDSERIRVWATDRGAGEPRKRSPRPTEPSGRGLQIVDTLSTDWGYEQSADIGKTVWFTLDIRAAAPAGDVDTAPEPAEYGMEQAVVSQQTRHPGRSREMTPVTRPRQLLTARSSVVR